MKLSDLQLNRQLYRTQPQTAEVLGADAVASNEAAPPSTAIASGNSVTDINTNAEQINGDVIAPGTIPPSTLDISNFGWTQTCAFSVIDSDTVSWSSGNFTSADGSNTYALAGGTTGNMGASPARTYVYLDIDTSTVEYQVSTSITAPIGIGKVLIAVCQAAIAPSTTATYALVQATQIVGDNVIANTIDAQKLNVGQLSAITADLGTITAGSITGITITGSLFRTATSGQRIEITSSPTNLINFYDDSDLYGSLEVESSGGSGHINLSTPDGAGLFLDTDVGSSGYGGATLSAQGGLVDVSGNATNSYSTLGIQGGGSVGIHGGPSGDEIFSDDGGGDYVPFAMDLIPKDDLYYFLGSASFQWQQLYVGQINGLNSLSLATSLILTGTASFTRNSIIQPTFYHGYVSGTSITKSNTSFTATNPSTGNYTITHNFGSVNYTVQLTVLRASGTGAYTAKLATLGSDTFDVIVFNDTGTSVDSDFMFLLVKN